MADGKMKKSVDPLSQISLSESHCLRTSKGSQVTHKNLTLRESKKLQGKGAEAHKFPNG